MTRPLAAALAVSLAALLAALLAAGCCCGLLRDDAQLEPAERPLGSIDVEDTTIAFRAELSGRYRREHHGGGRFGYSTPTDEEIWSLRVIPDGEATSLAASLSGGWTLDDRAQAVERLNAVRLESCPTEGGVVFRVVGIREGRWMCARSSEGWAFFGPFDGDADDCARAATMAPSIDAHLRAVWEDGVRAWIELAARREDQAGVGMSAGGHSRLDAGIRACQVLTRRGDAEEALRCFWALRVWANRSLGDANAAMDLINRGPAATPDFEAAMFRLAGALEPHPDPELAATIAEHTETVLPSYLQEAPTQARIREFLEASLTECAQRPCPAWRLTVLGRYARRLADPALCDRVLASARAAIESPEGQAGGALQMIRGVVECGSEDAIRAALIAGLSRRTISADAEPPGTCTPGAIIPGTYDSTVCPSLPRYAGSWLGAHCHPDAVAAAHEVLRAIPDDALRPYYDALTEGALRVLSSCDPAGLRAALIARGRPDLVPAAGP